MAETLAIFPLSTVLLPGVGLSLHIFEPRYRQLIVHLMSGALPYQQFGIVAIKQCWPSEVTQLDQLYQVGCTAKLCEVERLPDGRFDITTVGKQRFRLLALTAVEAPYLLGTVDWLPDIPVPEVAGDSIRRLSDSTRNAHHRYCEAASRNAALVTGNSSADATTLAHTIASDCLLPIADRQKVLEETHPLRRLTLIRHMLNREAVILRSVGAIPAPLNTFGYQPSRN